MKKIEFGFIQGRMTSPPSKKSYNAFPKKIGKKNFIMQKNIILILQGILVKENSTRAIQFGIIKLKKYICHFHTKDKNWKGENVVLGNGKVNFDLIFKAIKHIKYVGKYTFETNRGDNPIKTMCDNKNFILNKIKQLK